jgi:hypothetical protein
MIHKLLGIGENRATNLFLKMTLRYIRKFLTKQTNKQTRTIFGLNGKEPKLKMFQLFFGLLHETKNLVSFGLFHCVSAFRTCIETTETNMTDSKQILTNK